MKNYQEYFVRVFDGREKEPIVKGEEKFEHIEDVFRWMEQNTDELFSVYGSDCILDLS